jgi:hypothetical protein
MGPCHAQFESRRFLDASVGAVELWRISPQSSPPAGGRPTMSEKCDWPEMRNLKTFFYLRGRRGCAEVAEDPSLVISCSGLKI